MKTPVTPGGSGLFGPEGLGMDAFVGGFACCEAEQALGTGADGLPDEITGINRGHRKQRDSFKSFHRSWCG